MDLETAQHHMTQELEKTGLGFILYLWEKTANGRGTGVNSADADLGDALVAIDRIIKQFGIHAPSPGGECSL